MPVIYVDPKETSQKCPRCGNVSRANRKNQGWFQCTKCGYQSDADRVGALNIAAKALDARGAWPCGKGEGGTPHGQGDDGGPPPECWLTSRIPMDASHFSEGRMSRSFLG